MISYLILVVKGIQIFINSIGGKMDIAQIILGGGLLGIAITQAIEIINKHRNVKRFKKEIAFELFRNLTILELVMESYGKLIENPTRMDVHQYTLTTVVLESAISSGIILSLRPQESHLLVDVLQRFKIVQVCMDRIYGLKLDDRVNNVPSMMDKRQHARNLEHDLTKSTLYLNWEKKYRREYLDIKKRHWADSGFQLSGEDSQ